MQISNNSQINFSGIEIVTSKLIKGNTKKVVDALDNMTLGYTNPLLRNLEKDASADIFIKVEQDGKMNFSLVRKYSKFDFDESGEVIQSEKIIPLVNSKGQKIESTIDSNAPSSKWRAKLNTFLKKCETYLTNPENPKNSVLDDSLEPIYIRNYEIVHDLLS